MAPLTLDERVHAAGTAHRRASARSLAGAVALFLSFAAANARAGHAIHLEYTQSGGCPDRQAFLADIGARTNRLQLAADNDDAPTYRVRVAWAEGRAEGRLEIVDVSGLKSTRDVSGATCNAVVDALALVVALAIDQNASTAPLVPEPAPPPPQPVPTAVATAPSARTPPAATAPPAPAPPRASRWRVGAAVGAEIAWGLSPHPVVAGSLIGEASRERVASGRVELAFHVRWSAVHADSGLVAARLGSTRFRWTLARMELCPLHLTLGPILVMPCGRVDGGVLATSAVGVTHPNDATQGWLDAGAVGRVRWTPVAPLFVDAEGALALSVTRYHYFYREPKISVYDVPAAGGTLGVAVGVRFW